MYGSACSESTGCAARRKGRKRGRFLGVAGGPWCDREMRDTPPPAAATWGDGLGAQGGAGKATGPQSNRRVQAFVTAEAIERAGGGVG